MMEPKEKMWDALASLDSETLLHAIVGYHGMQLLDEGFGRFLVDEGLMDFFDDNYEEDEEGEDKD
jgi:hypothetical protein